MRWELKRWKGCKKQAKTYVKPPIIIVGTLLPECPGDLGQKGRGHPGMGVPTGYIRLFY